MTPPDANIKKQKRRHWPVFWGIAAAILLAVVAWLGVNATIEEPEEPVLEGEAPATAAPAEETGTPGE